jgi:hypothetical protein
MYTYETTPERQDKNGNQINGLGIFKSDFSGFFEATKAAAKKTESSHSDDTEFCGGDKYAENFESALRLETDGYNAQAINETLESLNEYEAGEAKIEMDYAGDTFDVGSLVSGELKHWFATTYEAAKPRIHLVVMPNGNCHVEASNWLNQAACVVKVAETLSETCDVAISAVYVSRDSQDAIGNGRSLDTIKMVSVKDYGENVDLRRLGAVSHPSFFRRLIFGIIENANKGFGEYKNGFGYGQSRDTYEDINVSREQFAEILGDDKFILTPNASKFNSIKDAVDYARVILLTAQGLLEEEVAE